MPHSSPLLSSPPVSVDPPLGLDPREPPVSPRIGSRTPTRGTPISSRAASPSNHVHSHPSLPPSLLNPAAAHSLGAFGSIPSSPTSVHSRQHIHSREEDADSSLFERDVESLEFATIPSSTLAHSTSSSALAAGAASPLAQPHLSPARPSSASPAGGPHHSHIHHPHARASATDQVFPTVLDDAVEALSSSTSDVFVVSPSRSGSPSGLPGRRSFGAAGGVEGLMYDGGMSSGQRSPVMSFSASTVEGRERRSSTVSLTGQAGRMLDGGDGPGGSHGFRLTLPGEDHSTLIPTSSPASTHSSPPLAPGPPGTSSPSNFASPSSSNPAVNPNAHRLSFISPQDLIISPPLSTLSLSSITSGASAPTNLSTPSGSAAQSPSVVGASGPEAGSPPVGGEEGKSPGGDEWKREGLGKGLESRLENLLREEGTNAEGGGRVVSPAP